MEILNSKEHAIFGKKWSNPGASFYDKIKDSKAALNEAYLVHGKMDAPYTSSGYKYPHHSLNSNGDLVVNAAGVKAAYQRAKQMGIFKGEVKKHLMRHYKELGIYQDSQMQKDELMKENFEYIESVLGIDENAYMEGFNIDLEEGDPNELIKEYSEWIDDVAHNGFTEASHGKLKYDFRYAYDKNTGHLLKIVYELDNINIDYAGHAYNPEDYINKRIVSNNKAANAEVQKNISKEGNVDHISHGQKVLAIIDVVTGQKLDSAETISPMASGTEFTNGNNKIDKDEIDKRIKSGLANQTIVKVGEIDNSKSFKSTGIFGDFNKASSAQLSMKTGRGSKIKDFKTNYKKDDLQFPVFNNPSNKEGKDYITSWISNYVSMNKDEPDVVDDTIRAIKIWNSGGFEGSPEFEAAKKKKFDTVILYSAISNFQNDGKTKEAKILKDVISNLTKQNMNESWSLIDYSGFIPEGYNSQYMCFRETTESIIKYDDDIEEVFFIKSDNGIDNACVRVKGYDHPMRGRSSMITLKIDKDEVYVVLKKHQDGDYGVPGGGWDKGEDPKDTAVRELHEEAQLKVKDVKRMGTLIEYSGTKDNVKNWVKEHVPEKDWWYGYYSAVFVGIYDGKFKGHIEEIDKESGWDFVKYEDIKKDFPKEYCDAIEKYIGEQFIESFELFEEDSKTGLKYEFRYVINEKNGHLIKIIYEMKPENVTADNATKGEAAENLRKNISKTGHTNYQSSGNKILGLVDMCDNSRINHVSAYPVIHNVGGSIMPMKIKRYMGIMKRFVKDENKLKEIENNIRSECPTGICPDPTFDEAIKNSKAQGQNPIEYKVGMIDNTETYKTTNPHSVLKNMLHLESSKYITEADENPPELSDEEIKEETPVEEEKKEENQTEEIPAEVQSEEPPELEDEPTEQPAETTNEEEPPALEEPEETAAEAPAEEEKKEEKKPLSMPKQTDAAEKDANGVNRKKLYIAFINWAKTFSNKNIFGSIFDKDAFKVTYPFIPHEMRYFYRLANPILCVLSGDLTFFQASELRKLNKDNKKLNEMIIFAATPNDLRVFNINDKKVYKATFANGIILGDVLAQTFDLYIQNMVNHGDYLNGQGEDEDNVGEEV